MNEKRRKRRRKTMSSRQKVVARQKRILGGVVAFVFILIAAVCFWGKSGSEKEIETANVYPEKEGKDGDRAAAGLSESQVNDPDTNLKNNTENTSHTARGPEIDWQEMESSTEKEFYPDDIQKTLGHLAIDEGADLVVGHHPHVLQGIEEYNGKNIVYSLGNFCFGGNSNPSVKDTMIFQQTFTIEDGVKVEDNRKNIIPCSLTSGAYGNNYQPIPLTGAEKERVLQDLETYSSIF